MNHFRKATRILLILIIMFAYIVFSYLVFKPLFLKFSSQKEAKAVASSFLETSQPDNYPEEMLIVQGEYTSDPTCKEDQSPSASETSLTEYDELYTAMQCYNNNIYCEGQRGLYNPWSDSAPVTDLSKYGLDDDAVLGVLQIPTIDVTLPIYSGASYSHLDKGAAVLSQTSLPIGGINTNTVIGAHRGWNAEDYLRDIEDVQLGDQITVTNLWEQLHYSVTEIKIILPNDLQQIRIQEGRDLLTIFTCHPYASGGKYRYLLICDRVPAPTTTEDPISSEESLTETAHSLEQLSPSTPTASKPTPTICIEGEEFLSAKSEIKFVALLPWIGIVLSSILFLAIVTSLVRSLCSRHSHQNDDPD